MYNPQLQYNKVSELLTNIELATLDGKIRHIGEIVVTSEGIKVFWPMTDPLLFRDHRTAIEYLDNYRSHWGTWIQRDDPTTGVYSPIPDYIWEDIDYTGQSIDMSLVNYLDYAGIPYDIHADGSVWYDDDQEFLDPDLGETITVSEALESFFMCRDAGDYLVGAWYYDAESAQYDVLPETLHTDDTLPYAAIVNGDSNTCQVIWSKYVARGSFCSPCYPGQVDASADGDQLYYALPPEYLDRWDYSHDPEVLTIQSDVFCPVTGQALIMRGDTVDRQTGIVTHYGASHGLQRETVAYLLNAIMDTMLHADYSQARALSALQTVLTLHTGAYNAQHPAKADAYGLVAPCPIM